MQSETVAAPYPGGSGGYHRVVIDLDERNPARECQFVWWLADHVRGRFQLAWLGLLAWHSYRPSATEKPPQWHHKTIDDDMAISESLGELRTLEIEDGYIEYRICGKGPGPALVFLHSIIANADVRRSVVLDLSYDHLCVAPD